MNARDAISKLSSEADEVLTVVLNTNDGCASVELFGWDAVPLNELQDAGIVNVDGDSVSLTPEFEAAALAEIR